MVTLPWGVHVLRVVCGHRPETPAQRAGFCLDPAAPVSFPPRADGFIVFTLPRFLIFNYLYYV